MASKTRGDKLIGWACNLILAGFLLVLLAVLWRVFVGDRFVIPTESMIIEITM